MPPRALALSLRPSCPVESRLRQLADQEAATEVAERAKISDRVFLRLRDAIVSGELAEGSLHSIYGIAEQFGVSRTPARDAVLRLADAGMVIVERNRGVRVSGIGVDDVRRIFELRLLLEVPATRFAAAHCTTDRARLLDEDVRVMLDAAHADDIAAFVERDIVMHERIIDAMGNERLTTQVRALREKTLAMDASTFDRSRSLLEVHEEHVPIVGAVIARNPRGAGEAMSRHLLRTADLLMQQVGERTGEGVLSGWADDLLAAASAPS